MGSQDFGAPRCRLNEPEQHSHDGGLPCPIGAKESVDLTTGDTQVEVVYGQLVAVTLSQADGPNQIVGRPD
jgi:hypothetical protein